MRIDIPPYLRLILTRMHSRSPLFGRQERVGSCVVDIFPDKYLAGSADEGEKVGTAGDCRSEGSPSGHIHANLTQCSSSLFN